MRIKITAMVLLLAVTLTACTRIDYSESYTENPGQTTVDTTVQSESEVPPANIITENLVTKYDINPMNFSYTLEAETLLAEEDELFTGIEPFSGDGYIALEAYQSISFTVDAVSSQHYDIVISACGDGGAVALTVGGTRYIDSENGQYKILDGETHGTYKVAQSKLFTSYSVAPAYLAKGKRKITLQAVNGSVYIDKISVTETTVSDSGRYDKASTSLSGDGINYNRIQLMEYLGSIYGEKTLLAQYCTPGTNAEIEAVYRNIGRYPAIRFSDLMYYTEAGYSIANEPGDDISLALGWAEQGGIVGYSWYWYSPIGKATLYSSEVDFDVSQVVTEGLDVAVLSEEELQLLLEDETITQECYTILTDMDSIAQKLSVLNENNVPVLFKPLACTDSAMYWWETDETAYIWLWQTMQRRFEELHGLSNLIWVCPVKQQRMYPGDDYVDIIGCDVYNNSNVSNLVAMINADGFTLNRKMLALTECCFNPDPDILYRDNAMWLWTAPWCGKYLINEKGQMTGDYITVNQLKKIYSHNLTIARDEIELE